MSTDKEDRCSLTSMESVELKLAQKATREDIAEIRDDVKELIKKVDTLYMQDAGRVGYAKGASSWFKVGVYSAVFAIISGILFIAGLIIAAATGKIDIITLLKQL